MLITAKDYLSRGFSVIPIRREGKEPLTPWKQFQDERPDEQQLSEWFGESASPCNIGIVTGAISGLVVVDLDTPEAVTKARANEWFITPHVKTSRGYHLYFRYRERLRNFQSRTDLPGIDFRGEGGYVVAPPSLHASGHRYEWVAGGGLDDLPLAEVPDIFCSEHADKASDLKELYTGVDKGGRNNALTRIAGSLVADGLSYDDCLPLLLSVNSRNRLPLDEREVRQVLESISKRHAEDGTKGQEETKPDATDPSSTQSESLLQLAASIPLFHDQHGETFGFVNNETVRLGSSGFQEYLAFRFQERLGKAPGKEALSQAVRSLQGTARYKSEEMRLHNRVGALADDYFYDLGKGSAVRVSPGSWSIVEASPLFRRYAHQSPQGSPSKEGDITLLFKYLRVRQAERPLVVAYVVSCFVPGIAHPLVHIHGPQGSGKTTASRVLRAIVDPSHVETTIIPTKRDDLIQTLAHNYMIAFDNMSAIPTELSDLLCQACTGGGISKRKLYSDDDVIIYRLQHCIVLNGIAQLISRPDLMDRSLLFELDSLGGRDRMDERTFWGEFHRDLPEILGEVFTVLSKAMDLYPRTTDHIPFRMADFARWGIAITLAMGESPETFTDAYSANRHSQRDHLLEDNTLFHGLQLLLEARSHWEGTFGQAFEELRRLANPRPHDATFPGSPRYLRDHLQRLEPHLREESIEYRILGKTSGGRMLSLSRMEFSGSSGSLGSGEPVERASGGDADIAVSHSIVTPESGENPSSMGPNDSDDAGDPETVPFEGEEFSVCD